MPSTPSPYVSKFFKPMEEILGHENIRSMPDKDVFLEGIWTEIKTKFETVLYAEDTRIKDAAL